jgi:hypothetical protein
MSRQLPTNQYLNRRDMLSGRRYNDAIGHSSKDHEIIRKRRGPEMRDSAEAEIWAQNQPWYDRIAKRGSTLKWWVWRLLPDVAR